MSSILPGFEYDIFISYRQKDNKYDGWVTEFVDHLKKELEATFKEDISVYFDINPHDGLLETHDVDESLKSKLKCLIFIPIISRTYCDPKSFAWEHEFRAFVEQASQDQFGMKVRLPTGNVASRVLPVRIHDLDEADIKSCEEVTGSFLRGVEFIYKEPGVNRSLTPGDDDKTNLNKTRYRNQINKVALAIREIFAGLQAVQVNDGVKMGSATGQKSEVEESENKVKVGKNEKRENKTKIFFQTNRRPMLWTIGVAVLLAIVAILAWPKLFKQNALDKLRSPDGRISVAVMPFKNMTNDTIWNVWQGGIQELLTASLSSSEELRVRQAESVNNLLYGKGPSLDASSASFSDQALSKKLDVKVLINGNINRAGEIIRINAQLIEAKTGEAYKSFLFEGPAREEIIFGAVDSLSGMLKDFLILSELNKESLPYSKLFLTTTSPEAYRYYNYGSTAFSKRDYRTAISMYLKSIALDPDFAFSEIRLAVAYGNLGIYDQAKEWCLKAYSKSSQLPEQVRATANWAYALYFETPYEEIKHLRHILEFDDQIPAIYYILCLNYNRLGQYERAIPEGEKSLQILNNWGLRTSWVNTYTSLGVAYHRTGQLKKEKELYKKAEEEFPDDPILLRRQAILSFSLKDSLSAHRYLVKYAAIQKENSTAESAISTGLAQIYSEAGMLDQAEDLYRQALESEPGNPDRLNNIAGFLIEKDRDVDEGVLLIDRALQFKSDDYEYLHTKGRGLFKQGKHREALDMLQKSWDLRRRDGIYDHTACLHLEEAKKAVAQVK